MYYPEYVAVAELARRLDRPVKWIETRREHTLVACVERDQVHDVEIGATRDGRLLALRDDFLHDMGAYTISGLNLPQNAMIHSVGPYVIPSLDLRFRAVITTTTPVGAYRGAGRPYGTAVIERAMDALAAVSASTPWRSGGGTSSPPTGIRTRPVSPPRGAGRSSTTPATIRAAWISRSIPSTSPRCGASKRGCAPRGASWASASSTTSRPPPPCRSRARSCGSAPTGASPS
jgi:hypothetical protein